jgi:hypothetical protein
VLASVSSSNARGPVSATMRRPRPPRPSHLRS